MRISKRREKLVDAANPPTNHRVRMASWRFFTKAQLLQKGFSICLHAYRYSIPIPSKKKKHKSTSKVPPETETPIAELDLQVGLAARLGARRF
jgi:hypothetical protein